jgi:hypothetical protein
MLGVFTFIILTDNGLLFLLLQVFSEPGEESKPVGAPAAHSVMKTSLPPSAYTPGYDNKPRFDPHSTSFQKHMF